MNRFKKRLAASVAATVTAGLTVFTVYSGNGEAQVSEPPTLPAEWTAYYPLAKQANDLLGDAARAMREGQDYARILEREFASLAYAEKIGYVLDEDGETTPALTLALPSAQAYAGEAADWVEREAPRLRALADQLETLVPALRDIEDGI